MEKGERLLASRHSRFYTIHATENKAGLRTLYFGKSDSRQSVVKPGAPRHLELPYIALLPNSLAFAGKLSRILMVGLGGGTLPTYFRDQFPKLHIDVVEIDPVVVELAKEFFGFAEDARMRVHIEDGRDFIERQSLRYDLIILDGFNGDTIPPHLRTLEFLQAVRNALTPAGIVVANVWGRTLNRLYDHLLLTYREAFDDLYILDVPEVGTKLFVALQRKRAVTRDDLLNWAAADSLARGIRHDFIDALAGFKNSDDEAVRGGGVLRD